MTKYNVYYTNEDGYVKYYQVETKKEAIKRAQMHYKEWGKPDKNVKIEEVKEIDFPKE